MNLDVHMCDRGNRIKYHNRHGQHFEATVESWHHTDGEAFLAVRRSEWQSKEYLPLSSFSDGTYTLDDVK